MSDGHLLLNAYGRVGTPGSTVTSNTADEVLLPGESMTVDFVIGLQNREKFTFVVDLLGVAE